MVKRVVVLVLVVAVTSDHLVVSERAGFSRPGMIVEFCDIATGTRLPMEATQENTVVREC